ncbi:MAG: tryptophan synthase subunit alpha [Candidatus Brocadia sp. AMX2]|uniref:tryptophan synthase subunit alpha n=1 Tax=Candidatus Brocadia sp. AMX2 TaxID=2293635 RepID=UPI000ECF6AF0|nr:tryptophan synthase subunit alpha [Candidatus Brocadia sp. AMX2]MBC6931456.1 tryptophan synthase subunit alpha [Candidatus Brocadia sp.]KAA0244940.1 MAG: tryptophan synthase subunit alpha [Candidatus Brocadia sp. AMX2]MCE7866704.1 tryptophan synthase subunit alpha [Candidatus Brocadia sp. AMX2]MCQ3916565.1 tryptophan synthase subunit alpha [Candidatus Brocadia sp.]MDL1935375.1 tryptophan synthase subunit alpha [Candidatus Brocadia sp. AMX2]
MNRIDKKFQELKAKNKTAFIPFITAGDPDLQTTKALILEFEKRGADIIELGIPFSDPIADGPIIQASYYRALVHGVKVAHILDMVSELRNKSEIPIVSMVSYSTVYRGGCHAFVEKALKAGLDGLTIPDLPVEENYELFSVAEKNDFKIVCFVAPTTTDERMALITQKSQGFLYYISVVGITGIRDRLPEDIVQNINKLKKITNTPVAVGFGVSTAEHAKMVGKIADGVIVGSAIMREIEKYAKEPSEKLVKYLGEFVGQLVLGAKG